MPFKKGESGNKEGRRKGEPNKITSEIRDKLKLVIEGEMETVADTLKDLKLENKQQYLSLVEKFMAYVIPKKRDITSDDKPIQPAINISECRTESKADRSNTVS